jgi:hypothetical protein
VRALLNPVVINKVRADVNTHLAFYIVRSHACGTACGTKSVKTTDQFTTTKSGPLNLDVTLGATSLLQKSNLSQSSTPPSSTINANAIENNYLCYVVNLSPGSTFTPRTITVKEQNAPELFTTSIQLTVKAPIRLCNRITATPNANDNHLVCYSVTPPSGFTLPTLTNFSTNNSYGPDTFKVKTLDRICVPASMTILP